MLTCGDSASGCIHKELCNKKAKEKQRKQGTNHSLNIWWQSASTHLPQPSFVVRSKHTQDTATIYGYTRVQACKQHVHTTRKHKPHTQTCVQCVRLRNASEYSNTEIANTIVMTSLKVAEYGGLEPIWHPCFSCSCSCCSCCTERGCVYISIRYEWT